MECLCGGRALPCEALAAAMVSFLCLVRDALFNSLPSKKSFLNQRCKSLHTTKLSSVEPRQVIMVTVHSPSSCPLTPHPNSLRVHEDSATATVTNRAPVESVHGRVLVRGLYDRNTHTAAPCDRSLSVDRDIGGDKYRCVKNCAGSHPGDYRPGCFGR